MVELQSRAASHCRGRQTLAKRMGPQVALEGFSEALLPPGSLVLAGGGLQVGKPEHSPAPAPTARLCRAKLGNVPLLPTGRPLRSHETARTPQHREDQQPAATEPTQRLKQSFRRHSN